MASNPLHLSRIVTTFTGMLVSVLLVGCASVDLGGPRVAKDHPQAGILTTPDDATYAILPEQFNYTGTGAYVYPDGRALTGSFVNGALHGRGTEETLQHTYEGTWRNGIKHGKGELKRTDGSRYTGQFQNNLPHGKGEEQNARGTYTGDFASGRYQGEGQFKYGDYAFYRGQWYAGKRQGFGEYSHVSGERYVGDWQQGAYHGFGNKTYADNGNYEGAWRGGQRQGYGKYESPRGITYEGTWADDNRQGFGAQASPDGIRYEGEWLADKRHGTGKLSRPDGSYHEGNWSEDFILGPGVRRNTGGVEISGVWNQDFISHGLLTFPNGQEYAGPLFKEKGKQVASQLITWLEQPGNNTDPHIQLFLAGVYRDFVKPAPDLSVSELWLSRAAAGGLAQAQFELALAQLEQDAGSAVRNLQRAASQGHAGASQRLGEFHHVGLHVERDPQQAAAYYATAVAKGSVVATNNLAWLLATTTDTDVANPEQAIELIQPLVVYLGNWQHIDTYAAALARLGNFTRARRMQTLALEHAQTEADDATMEQMQARLALYQAKTEYQE